MAQIIKCPSKEFKIHDKSVFLAGSIEMDTAVDWQKEIEITLSDKNVTIYNPRRESWDSSWEQTITDNNFREQVEWELDKLEKSDIILMHFSPNTRSPISLLELGIFSNSGKLVVSCPDGFWRKGNIEIVCERYNILFFNSLDESIRYIKSKI